MPPHIQAWSGLAAAARAAVGDRARLAVAYRKWKVRQFHKVILRTWRHQVCICVGVGVGYRASGEKNDLLISPPSTSYFTARHCTVERTGCTVEPCCQKAWRTKECWQSGWRKCSLRRLRRWRSAGSSWTGDVYVLEWLPLPLRLLDGLGVGMMTNKYSQVYGMAWHAGNRVGLRLIGGWRCCVTGWDIERNWAKTNSLQIMLWRLLRAMCACTGRWLSDRS